VCAAVQVRDMRKSNDHHRGGDSGGAGRQPASVGQHAGAAAVPVGIPRAGLRGAALLPPPKVNERHSSSALMCQVLLLIKTQNSFPP
jgi:hypothetical protein